MTQSKNKFLKLANHQFKIRMYLLYKLPAAFFSGIRIKECTEEQCITLVPYKWLTQNPFRSTYFASLAMAAEMSTGMLVLSNVHKRATKISMLVTKMDAVYFKKATGITYFTCTDGLAITTAVNEAEKIKEGTMVSVKSEGRNKEGKLIAEFLFTWSFRKKSININ